MLVTGGAGYIGSHAAKALGRAGYRVVVYELDNAGRQTKIMDATAFALARENRIPIIVFSIAARGAIEAVLRGKGRSTIVGG